MVLADTSRDWKPLYRIGAGTALASVFLIVLAVLVFIAWPPPTTVAGHFTLLQGNPLRGLLDLDLLMVISYVTMIPLYLALYVALRAVSPALMTLATALSLIAITLMLQTNSAFAMLLLSGQYAGATADTERSTILAAGHAALANSQGTAFDVSYVTSGVAVLLIAVVMLRSSVFSRTTAYMGLAMGALMLIPATAGTFGLLLSLISLVPTAVWLVLVRRRLARM